MRLYSGLAVFILSMSCAPVFGAARTPVRANLALGEKAIGQMPAWFEPNLGQMDRSVRFAAR
jgi:hypothetical protein